MSLGKLLIPGIIIFYLISLSPAYAQEEKCKEYWICTDWSFCMGSGVQMRSCTDVNRCTTENERPAETQECTPQPIREVNVPQPESPGVTGLLVYNTPTILGIIVGILGIAAYILYRKWKDLKMFISPP